MPLTDSMPAEMAHEITWGVPCGPTLGIMWQHQAAVMFGLYLVPYQARMIERLLDPEVRVAVPRYYGRGRLPMEVEMMYQEALAFNDTKPK